MPIATYTVGPPVRPPITHDNGFLDRFARRSPNSSDWVRLSRWIATLEAAEAAQGVPFVPHNDISDALGAYRHFLFGNGRSRTFSYERFVANDRSGAKTLENAIIEAEQGAQQIYWTQYPGQATARFSMTGTALSCGGGPNGSLFPYPATENWQKAIGAHYIWLSAEVTVTNPSGLPNYTMVMTLHAEDRYNFNPGASDIATGIPDSDNGMFEVTGLAQQYDHFSTLARTASWTRAGTPSSVSEGPGRQRQPDDNRRVRNRT